MPFTPGQKPSMLGGHRTATVYQRKSGKPIPQVDIPAKSVEELSKRVTALQRQMCAFQEEMENMISDLTDVMKMEFMHVVSQMR